MGPTQDPPQQRAKQERSRWAAKRRKRRPRLRRCLLKGCEQRFRPKHPRSRYCGDDCRSQARRWSRWKAQKRYRATGLGKQQRKAQSRRHRERVRARKRSKSATNEPARVITAKIFDGSCDRPGCYVLFVRTSRSPLQRFCSQECRRALERVLEREQRWRERRRPELALACFPRTVRSP